jgi:Predicted metal-dependent hydrolase of the TIM-barrel fold
VSSKLSPSLTCAKNPLISQKRWLKEFDAIPIDGEIKKKILKDNAERLLK